MHLTLKSRSQGKLNILKENQTNCILLAEFAVAWALAAS